MRYIYIYTVYIIYIIYIYIYGIFMLDPWVEGENEEEGGPFQMGPCWIGAIGGFHPFRV